MKRYDTYKDSGVEWLGEIPKHWEIKELKHLSSSQPYSFVDGPFGSDLKNEEYVDEGIPLIQLNNIGIGEHLLKNKRFITSEKSEQLSKHKAYPGEIVIAKMAEPVARAAKVSEEFSQYNIVADCIKFKPDDKLVISDLLVAIINSEYVRTQAELKATGTTRLRISLDTAKRLKVAIPPYKEQVALGKYIKEKTLGIDKIIQQKEFLLEKLQAKRQAIISEAVTKGLNPNIPMKSSGIGWLEDIPENWQVKRIKHITEIQGRIGFKGYTKEDLVEAGEGALTLGAKHIDKFNELKLSDPEYISWEKYYESPEIMVRQGDLIFTQRGSLGKVAVVRTDIGPATINPSMILLKNQKIDPEFFYYFLISNFITSKIKFIQTSTAVPMISQRQLGDFEILVPSESEQKEIVMYLNKISKKFRELEDLVINQIEKLNAYRQSLISEVVTGKIKVV